MVLPNLIHPVAVVVEPLARASSVVDDDFREPIQNASRPNRYTVKGQINWGFDDDNRPTFLGTESQSEGYVLFRFKDLRAAGINAIKQGDRFLSFGSGPNQQNVDVYVVKIKQMGHYPDQKGPALVRAYFQDRHPSNQTRGGV